MQNLPTGARALLIALQTPAPNGLVGIPVLLWGRPGVGKSSFIEGLANEDLKVLTIIASIHDPTDFSGLPVHENGKVRYAAPAWVSDFGEHGQGILFLDELSTSPPAVQAALLRVVFERRVGFAPLPDHVRIVAAANPPDLMVGGWELSPPMRNRFVHLNWDISPTLFTRALAEGWQKGELPHLDRDHFYELLPRYRALVAAFLRVSPQFLHGDPSVDKYGYASPRSWEYAVHLLTACATLELPTNLDLLSGCLGEGTAVALAQYLDNLRLPDPEAVLAGKEDMDLTTLDDGEVYILFTGMEGILQNDRIGDDYLPYSLRFLELNEQMNAAGRRDVIFGTLRNLARAGFLTNVLAVAREQSPEDYSSTLSRINELFSDTNLVEFIDVLS